MKRYVWLTDLHLNFPCLEPSAKFLDRVAALETDGVLLGGDVSEWPDCPNYLRMMAERLAQPIYFVLGNHDYYFSSIATVRGYMERLCEETPRLVWLPRSAPIELAPGVGLIGHDGWADGRLGDYWRSLVMLNDYRLITELSALDKAARLEKLHQLGDETAAHIRRELPETLERFDQVVFLTHVPPFREACWYDGRISNDEWLPHFTCRAAGDALREIMSANPAKQLTVLCGHTHGAGEARILPNLHAITGGAQYGAPEIQRVFEWKA
jgi:predicted MPP superfamily phosphohydrolase